MKKSDESLVLFIKKGLDACSFENYMGLNLKKGRHTTLANSAKNDIDEQLRKERKETREIMRSIEKICQMDIYSKIFS